MTATCSCPPDDCHGGHTINVGPAWVCLPDDRLREFVRGRLAGPNQVAAMAAELLALRARVAELEAAQREPIGYGVAFVDGGGLYIHTAALLAREQANMIAERYRQWDARVVELREVTE